MTRAFDASVTDQVEVEHCFVLHGRLPKKQRTAVLVELESLDGSAPRVLLATGPVWEFRIHQNYLSQKDIEICLEYDVNVYADHEHYEMIKEFNDSFILNYQNDDE